jgi:Transcription factor S-II (TFIIS), central domain
MFTRYASSISHLRTRVTRVRMQSSMPPSGAPFSLRMEQPAAKRARRARAPPPAPSAEAVAAERAADEAALAELRVKSSLLLAEALGDDSPLSDWGCGVEEALDASHGAGSAAYRVAVRTLVASARRNSELGDSLRRGELTPTQLAACEPETLATQAQREARRQSERRRLAAADMSEGAGEETSEYVCPACGGKEARVLRFGGAHVEAPKSDTWGSKDRAETSAKSLLTCSLCKHCWTLACL